MTRADKDHLRATIASALTSYNETKERLAGLSSSARVETLAAQFVDSVRRVGYAEHLRDSSHSDVRADPASHLFDPLRAAVLQNRRGNTDEAWWLVFLATHFGKHSRDGWRLARDIYGRLGQGGLWDWPTISSAPQSFIDWYKSNEAVFLGADGQTRRFSNHRNYRTLKALSGKGPDDVLASYVEWIAPPRTPSEMIRGVHVEVGQNPHEVFDALYRTSGVLKEFGRLAKFDFLAMLGKLGIAPISPGHTYLSNSTGPLRGARLLFCNDCFGGQSARSLQLKLMDLGNFTGLSPQVLEDGLCNWQKSPEIYVKFKG